MEAAAFLAAAGGVVAAAKIFQSAVVKKEKEREQAFDTAAKATLRRCHSTHDAALVPADGKSTEVEVEHYPVMHLRQQFPDAPTFVR